MMVVTELHSYQLEEVRGLRFDSIHTEYDVCKFASILSKNRSFSALTSIGLEFEFRFPPLEPFEFDGVKFGFQIATGLN